MLRLLIVLIASGCMAGSASAVPLVYSVVRPESLVSVGGNASGGVDVAPDLLNTFPQFFSASGDSTSQPSPSSTLTADVGLPGFSGEITFSNLVIDYPLLGSAFSSGFVSVPLSITGEPIQLFAVIVGLTSLTITLDAPFTSTLTPGVDPGEWLWAGLADVTLSGVLDPRIIIPDDSVPNIDIPAQPFSQSLTIPLVGSFTGDPFGTRVHVGIDDDGTFSNLLLDVPAISETFDPLGTGLVSVHLGLDTFAITSLTTDVVYQNATPIPEPGTGALLALGLLATAARRRMR